MPRKKKIEGNSILLLGSSHLASHIAIRLLANENNFLTIVDRKDPNEVFLNPDMSRYEGAHNVRLLQLSQKHFHRQLNFGDYNYIVHALYIHDSRFSVLNPTET